MSIARGEASSRGHAQHPRYADGSGGASARQVAVRFLPGGHSSGGTAPFPIDAAAVDELLTNLSSMAGPFLSSNITKDRSTLYVVFESDSSVDAALRLGAELVGVVPAGTVVSVTREKADPRDLVANSQSIVLKNLAYDISSAGLMSHLCSLAVDPSFAPTHCSLLIDRAKGSFQGVAIVFYPTTAASELAMQLVHCSQYAGRTIKAEYKRSVEHADRAQRSSTGSGEGPSTSSVPSNSTSPGPGGSTGRTNTPGPITTTSGSGRRGVSGPAGYRYHQYGGHDDTSYNRGGGPTTMGRPYGNQQMGALSQWQQSSPRHWHAQPQHAHRPSIYGAPSSDALSGQPPVPPVPGSPGGAQAQWHSLTTAGQGAMPPSGYHSSTAGQGVVFLTGPKAQQQQAGASSPLAAWRPGGAHQQQNQHLREDAAAPVSPQGSQGGQKQGGQSPVASQSPQFQRSAGNSRANGDVSDSVSPSGGVAAAFNTRMRGRQRWGNNSGAGSDGGDSVMNQLSAALNTVTVGNSPQLGPGTSGSGSGGGSSSGALSAFAASPLHSAASSSGGQQAFSPSNNIIATAQAFAAGGYPSMAVSASAPYPAAATSYPPYALAMPSGPAAAAAATAAAAAAAAMMPVAPFINNVPGGAVGLGHPQQHLQPMMNPAPLAQLDASGQGARPGAVPPAATAGAGGFAPTGFPLGYHHQPQAAAVFLAQLQLQAQMVQIQYAMQAALAAQQQAQAQLPSGFTSEQPSQSPLGSGSMNSTADASTNVADNDTTPEAADSGSMSEAGF